MYSYGSDRAGTKHELNRFKPHEFVVKTSFRKRVLLLTNENYNNNIMIMIMIIAATVTISRIMVMIR